MPRSAHAFASLPVAMLLLALPFSAAAGCDGEMFQAMKQFAGTWQVYRKGELAGEWKMRAVAGGCAMLEEWRTVEGVTAVGLHWPARTMEENAPGKAVEENFPQEAAGETETPEPLLHQVYVDSNGWFIRADGSISEGVLVYEGKVMEGGEELVLRATLRGLGSDEIVHVGELSADAGETWQDSFTLIYRRVHQ